MKQRVRYIDLGRCEEGEPAQVIPADHPSSLVQNGKWTTTSPVLKILEQARGPVFETRNTIYHPGDTDESVPAYRMQETSK